MIKKIKKAFKAVTNLGGDVLSYPTRTLYDALRAGRDAQADSLRRKREIKKARISRGDYY
jgi:hypothetical protein